MLSAGSMATLSSRLSVDRIPWLKSPNGSQPSTSRTSLTGKSWCSAAAKATAQPTMKTRNWTVSESIFSSITVRVPSPQSEKMRMNHESHMRSRPKDSICVLYAGASFEQRARPIPKSSPFLTRSLEEKVSTSSIKCASSQRSRLEKDSALSAKLPTSSATVASAGAMPSRPSDESRAQASATAPHRLGVGMSVSTSARRSQLKDEMANWKNGASSR
mmetsp:Transcript_21239/g.68466  ORF Transcript_21239/g.68466 Transcript_21239/m.68466 type:complete len:217 (+) Transcript_21239:904-1554(+)